LHSSVLTPVVHGIENGLLDYTLKDITKNIPSDVTIKATAVWFSPDGYRDLFDLNGNVVVGKTHTSATQLPITDTTSALNLFKQMRDNTSQLDSQSTTDYAPRSIMFNYLVYKGETIWSNIWFLELADCDRPQRLSYSNKLIQKFEATQRELTAFSNVITAISSHRFKIPYQKSKIANLMKECFQTNTCKIHAFMHLRPTHEHWFGEDANIIQLFSRIAGVGMGIARSRDYAVDIFIMETENNKMEAELCIVTKVFPTFSKDVKFKDSQSYLEQSNAIITKALEAQHLKEEKERLKITEEAQEKSEGYMRLKINEWKSTIRKFREAEKEVDAEIKTIPNKSIELETELSEQLSNIQVQRQDLANTISEIDARIATLQEESELMNNYIAQFESKLKKFSVNIDEDRGLVEEQRDHTRTNWSDMSEQYTKEREVWKKSYTDKTRSIRQLHTELERSELDPFLQQILPSSTFEVQLSDIVNERVEVDSSESIAEFMADCDTRKSSFEVAKFKVKQMIDNMEKDGTDVNKEIETNRRLIEKRRVDMYAEKTKELQRWKNSIDEQLRGGTVLLKISDNGKSKKRYFWVAYDKICSCNLMDNGQPNKDKVTKSIPIKTIKQIILGQHTDKFKSYLRKSVASPLMKQDSKSSLLSRLNVGIGSPQTPTKRPTQQSFSSPISMPKDTQSEYYLSFSLVVKKSKTLDIVAEDKETYETWIVGLSHILGLEPMYGETLDMISLRVLNGNKDILDMTQEETDLCSRLHLSPAIFRSIRASIFLRRETELLTAIDIRMMDKMNLLQAETLYAYAQSKSWIPRSKPKAAFDV
jgi:hypothetical protein